jgi:hypothetical protein
MHVRSRRNTLSLSAAMRAMRLLRRKTAAATLHPRWMSPNEREHGKL